LINHKSALRSIAKLECGVDYDLNIAEFKGKRSLRQNAYMWALLGEIAEKMNYDNDSMGIYIQLLEQYSFKYDVKSCLVGDKEILQKSYRAIKLIQNATLYKEDGEQIEFEFYKCFIGSSKFTKEEMIVLIDGVLDLAVKCGIDTEYWTSVLC
jgi:hypothetical protein